MTKLDVLQAIFTRRSIRNFTGEPLNQEEVETVLKAGFSAPSAHNMQPWHFVVIKNIKKLEEIARLHPYAKMLPQAGCAILVCGDTEKQNMEGFLIEDCSAAIQNILLAAHGIGLGAVWNGIYPMPEFIQIFRDTIKLPETVIPVGMVVIGHKSQDVEATDRYDSTKIHYDQW